ncbi:hypothetical protein ZEAMMB73_Zm00001d044509 [Zea mays]|uniref:Uncharacterized protein n=1 Tax=Zea mays TaxID=4577 RepID=A0A1D6NMP4_MAIZE|nr:hypothetical protein ZEAMMB73_Zm00001d044509 [Zea mays]
MTANWDYSVKRPAQTVWSAKLRETAGSNQQPGEQTNSCISLSIMRDGSQDAWKHDYGWDPTAIQTDLWDNHQGSYEVPDGQGVPYGHWTHWRRRNNDSGRRNTRNSGGPISSKPMKSKDQTDEHNVAINGWRNCRVRNVLSANHHQQKNLQPAWSRMNNIVTDYLCHSNNKSKGHDNEDQGSIAGLNIPRSQILSYGFLQSFLLLHVTFLKHNYMGFTIQPFGSTADGVKLLLY